MQQKNFAVEIFECSNHVTFSLNDVHEPKSGKPVVKPKVFGKPDAIAQVRSFEKT